MRNHTFLARGQGEEPPGDTEQGSPGEEGAREDPKRVEYSERKDILHKIPLSHPRKL